MRQSWPGMGRGWSIWVFISWTKSLQVLPMPKLYSLSFGPLNDASITFANALRKENITHLQIFAIGNTVPLEQLIFPNLQYLDLESAGTKALSIINTNKDNLKTLKLKLNLFDNIDIPDIIIPNLQCLELWRICEKSALNLIKSNKNTIRKLKIWDVDFTSPLPVIQMPKLNCLFLAKKFSKLEFIKAFGQNISELWTPHHLGNICIQSISGWKLRIDSDSISGWKLESTEELNKLKVEADTRQ